MISEFQSRGSRQVTVASGSAAAVRTAAAIRSGSSQETRPVQAQTTAIAAIRNTISVLSTDARGWYADPVPLLAGSLLLLVLLAAPRALDPATVAACVRIDKRITGRKRFLAIREKERLLYPTDPTFSPYCEAHRRDPDCKLPGQKQAQEDLSRDVSELSVGPNGEAPETDPVLVPLYRKRRALACPGPKP